MDDIIYTIIVEKIVQNGDHGPYAVTNDDNLGSITFSLTPQVWKEKNWPELGTYVVLSQVIRKRAGWRAQHGRFLQPSDEKKGEKRNEN